MENRTALITGAAKRIGKEIVLHLAKNSWNLAIHYNSSKEDAMALRDYLKAIYPKQVFKVFCCDLSCNPESLISEVEKEFGHIDLLINNASVYSLSSIKKTSLDLLSEQMNINFRAPFILMRDYANLCKEGLIVNFLDTRITKFVSDYAAYSLSKVALAHLTQMGALEFGPNIRVNGIAPGSIIAPLGEDSSYLEIKAANTPMKVTGGMQAILKSMDYIIDNNNLTGQILYCDGGEQLI
ncbi:SDR family NAD(P)-dependent oxidoreductase [Ancylomarina sp. 16SWW S1-10-2]|uniref:SDR family NAD(P)-dependent oxidoreductase n=1 Tax=Ancylomarina sp. 16SWW S1-10-2 TaxID=2499681 RepID=UPI0012ADE735|nr:SDR family NAD(P)-dependent oxidoreductase [Ancylomarina sp. 16SWW S1-10-2]MRT94098.1 SDR family oxidoreductase [Ancylomarina sp. 16SWW S1-10-2]